VATEVCGRWCSNSNQRREDARAVPRTIPPFWWKVEERWPYSFSSTPTCCHYRLFDEVDWPKELGIPQLTLVFAPLVFAELDKFQMGRDPSSEGPLACVGEKLNALALSMTPVAVRRGVDAIGLDTEPPDAVFAQHRLERQSADDCLLASYYAFCEEHPADRTLILSADSLSGGRERGRAEHSRPDQSRAVRRHARDASRPV